ncbi:g1167 [Coccomyxa viridis]|uniref:G1167 protein n=1 Tax=Coccomyxa viridis TaxID=1274662 RepID=A0ABP1FKA8_9CHLO
MVKRIADNNEADRVEFIPLGAGQEVGRSCMLLKYRGKSVMLDCGIHPGYSGEHSLPYFDLIDLNEVDVMLITHFHLDHCAALPYVVGNTTFKGQIFMTHPTRQVCGMLLKDFVKVSRGSSEGLYTEKHLEEALQRTQLIDFHQTIEVNGIKVTAWRAGHVLGAAMFMVEIDGMRLLYTGDYSRAADRHMSAADLPSPKPHIVVVEATYGVSNHLPREGREQRLLSRVRAILKGGGRCLLPVVALGRAQELLLILEDHWRRNKDMQGVPIYQASGLATKALSVYQAYIEMMNEDIRTAFDQTSDNPFKLRYVTEVRTPGKLDDMGPCVVLATPSMLQSGLSRELFDSWCEDARNGIIICDFAVQGTLAREIQGTPSHVVTKAGAKVPLRMSVDVISFSAHADFRQTSGFIEALDPAHVILVHGEAVEMGRLRKELEKQADTAGRKCTLYTPKVGQPVHITHPAQHTIRVAGSLAQKKARAGAALQGVLVQQGGRHTVVAAQDLPAYTSLHPGRILQRQILSLRKPFAEVRLALEIIFEGVQGASDVGTVQATSAAGDVLRIADMLTLTHQPAAGSGSSASLILEWEGGPMGDMLADAITAVILQASGEPAVVSKAEKARRRALLEGDLKGAAAAEVSLLTAIMEAQFGPAHVEAEQGLIMMQVGDSHVVVDCKTGEVRCSEPALKARVETAVRRLMQALEPASLHAL